MLKFFIGAGKTGYNLIKTATHCPLYFLSPTLYEVH